MHVFYFLLLCLLFFNEEINSFYLPAEYRIKRQKRIKRAQDYLEQFGYFEKDIPPCPTKILSNSYCVIPNPYNGNVTEEEALKKFQKFTGLKETGIIDDETIEKMEEPRCGNSDAQNHIKTIKPPWKRTYLTYAFLNFPNNNETEEMRKVYYQLQILKLSKCHKR
uniref:Peptidoglycan binding-like domain-containing protein n=1 Tax=Panagrolaimus sp. PS1159 TaxID=55785 RepID=A0AC35FAH9_9BILA